jgi:hypothetical protein
MPMNEKLPAISISVPPHRFALVRLRLKKSAVAARITPVWNRL